MSLLFKILFTVLIVFVIIAVSVAIIKELSNKDYYFVKQLNGKIERWPVNSWTDKIGLIFFWILLLLFCLTVIFEQIWT